MIKDIIIIVASVGLLAFFGRAILLIESDIRRREMEENGEYTDNE